MATRAAAPIHHKGAGHVARSGPTERTWWEATREQWRHPSEWTVWNVVLLLALAALATLGVIWITRPGQPLGGAQPLSAGLVYADASSGYYVYAMQDPFSGQERAMATMQSLYDRHRTAAANGPLLIMLIRETAPPAPYITGTYDPASKEILGRVQVDSGRRVATVRSTIDAPMRAIDLRW